MKTTSATATQFLVKKDELAATQIREVPNAVLASDQVRVRVDRFALTSNNITYAAFGDAMNYRRMIAITDITAYFRK